MIHTRDAMIVAVAAASAALLAGCGAGSDGLAQSLPSVAASPADTPTPPATAPPTAPPTTGTTVQPPTTAATSAPSTTGSSSVGQSAPASALPGPGRMGACTDAALSLASDKASYPPGATVHLIATLVNKGGACTIQAGAERGFAIAEGSTTVWSSGCSSTPGGHTAVLPCPQFIALMPVKAGQTLARTQDWSQQADGTVKQVAAGSYTVGESWGGLRATTTITIG